MAYGRYFEEFTVGEIIRHWPGRTITEADCTRFALLTMNLMAASRNRSPGNPGRT